MTPSYSHLLIPSLALFVEHDLLSRRNAFYTQTGRFYSYVDPKTQLNAWGAPWPGFVYDSSIGMPVSGVYFDGSFVGRPTIHIDFNGGRILTSGTPTSVTGTFLRREFNIYTNAISEQLLLERAQSAIRQRYEHSQNYIAPNSIVAPFINLSKSNGSNYPFAYGGEDQTKTIVRATILTDNVYRAEGLADYFMDLARRCIPHITSAEDLPFNYFGDLKTGRWNYEEVVSSYDKSVFIDKVFVSRVNEIFNEKSDSFYLVSAELDVCSYRFPRQ